MRPVVRVRVRLLSSPPSQVKVRLVVKSLWAGVVVVLILLWVVLKKKCEVARVPSVYEKTVTSPQPPNKLKSAYVLYVVVAVVVVSLVRPMLVTVLGSWGSLNLNA